MKKPLPSLNDFAASVHGLVAEMLAQFHPSYKPEFTTLPVAPPLDGESGAEIGGAQGDIFISLLHGRIDSRETRFYTPDFVQSQGWHLRDGAILYPPDEQGLVPTHLQGSILPRYHGQDILELPPSPLVAGTRTHPQGPPALWTPRQDIDLLLQATYIPLFETAIESPYYRSLPGDSGQIVSEYIVLPPRASYEEAAPFCHATLHELCHAAGHPDRLHFRCFAPPNKSNDLLRQAREEIRVDLAATMLSQWLDVPVNTTARVRYGHENSLQLPFLTRQAELTCALTDAAVIARYWGQRFEGASGQEAVQDLGLAAYSILTHPTDLPLSEVDQPEKVAARRSAIVAMRTAKNPLPPTR